MPTRRAGPIICLLLAALHAVAAAAEDRARLEPSARRHAARPSTAGSTTRPGTGATLPLTEWLTYNPLNGEKLAQQTEVRAAYDDRYLYFAFRCLDPEPGKVRSTISRRDNMFNDDWVGMSLDSVGNGQSSYDLFINPAGVQGDILTTPSAGENSAPDFVWDSAGQRTDRGLRRRDAAAPHEHPVQERSRRAHGRAVLAAGEPSRHVGVVAARSRREAASSSGTPRWSCTT